MPRSLKVRPSCISTLKSSLLRHGFPSQKILAEELGFAQSTVSNFLNGKPVDFANFIELCRVLAREWRDIADFEDNSLPLPESPHSWKILISDRAPSSLSLQFYQGLSTAGHEVILPQATLNKTSSLQDYTLPLESFDYLLLLLSPNSLESELVWEQVRQGRELQRMNPQKLAILPIYQNLGQPPGIPFELQHLLEGIQPWQWRHDGDTNAMISDLISLLSEGRIALGSGYPWAVQGLPRTLNHSSGAIALVPLPLAPPELPEGQVEIASTFYINRPPIESRCYETITQPGALIRIKAPRQMGKTSLMARILHHAEREGSQTVAVSLQLADRRVFSSLNTFLQWFYASVSLELDRLDLERLAKYSQLAEAIGSNQSCKAYFEQYLLPELNGPLTLGLDEVDRLFEFPEIADDFFGLLRSLHEEAKRRDIWKQFRLIVVYSSEVYIPLDVNKSPFNVGLPIELPEFTPAQVTELAQRHDLQWHSNQVETLMELVGGHPYLVRLALYHIARKDVTLTQLVQESPTETGLYGDHLRRHLWNLEKYPPLTQAMKAVVAQVDPVRLPGEQGFKLQSMGLVKMRGNDCTPRCRLYAEYFGDRLKD
ncbi:AAA-like domain-containing protein [Laspinema olomoucense]|uniref:AAA-like domain-containing protein n=1 Tax=Laspinema olomoucense TaxID=3231600 RepID=UPI0021BADC4C|nr:AAA-like domain-containing protein [Laspinema sp. D3c]MCT7994428.1 AAA-like domain-containing protein [Laspinema sp. D3c]